MGLPPNTIIIIIMTEFLGTQSLASFILSHQDNVKQTMCLPRYCCPIAHILSSILYTRLAINEYNSQSLVISLASPTPCGSVQTAHMTRRRKSTMNHFMTQCCASFNSQLSSLQCLCYDIVSDQLLLRKSVGTTLLNRTEQRIMLSIRGLVVLIAAVVGTVHGKSLLRILSLQQSCRPDQTVWPARLTLQDNHPGSHPCLRFPPHC